MATTRGRRDGVVAAAGFALGDGIWAAGSMLGLAVVLARYGWLAELIRFAGGAYLVLLGLRALLRSRHRPAAAAGDQPVRRRSALLTGVPVDLGNPKAAVFFTSMFAALLPSAAPAWVGWAFVAVSMALPALWYSAVA